MKATFSFIVVVAIFTALLGTAAVAQIVQYSTHVTVTGNSLAQFQGGFQTHEFPLLNPQNVVIRGMYSYPCSAILRSIVYLVPADTEVVVLFDSSNDIRTGVTVQDHMACMNNTISVLLARNPALRIVVANTPPWTHWDPCTSSYRDDSIVTEIEAYNAAYADPVDGLQAQWPSNVRVADVWTPSVGQDGWALPQYMTGPCGVHPGDAGIWSASWQHFVDGYTGIVMGAVKSQW
jgi:GDSL-like Lipase/Acylhydrolase family